MLRLEELAVAAHKEALPGYSVFRKHRVLKEGNMVLIAEPNSKGELNVIAFPKPEHLNAFKQAASALRDRGPAVENPGAIGTLRFYVDKERKMLDSRIARRLKLIGAAKKSLYFGSDQAHY
ncbi:MAG: hypothetical protein V1817_03860, partial [Candidatus Micrarchaeota archaeon]